MSMDILERLRDEIIGDTELSDFFNERYNKQPSAFIGYKKAPSVSLLPCLCFVPIARDYEDKTSNMRYGNRAASILISIQEPNEIDGVFDGVRYLEYIIDRIVEIIRSQPFSEVIFSNLRVITDKGLRHPLYDAEIMFNYLELTHRS